MAANNQLIMNCNLYHGVRNPNIHPFSTMAMINYNSSFNSRHLLESQTPKKVYK